MKIHTLFLSLTLLPLLLLNACKKEEETPAMPETGTVSDVDGNSYKTVKIGNQWWMAENLKTTKYRNGASILSVTNDMEWSNLEKGAYCLYDNVTENNGVYGRLYNWFAINDSNNLAPVGWHIPSDAEWKTLEIELGMSQSEADNLGWRGNNEGEKLKIKAPLGWTRVSPVWGSNTSGFTALAGGCRLFNGTWADPGLFASGFWWSSSVHSNHEAWYRYLDKKNSNVYRAHTYKNYGFSVRCVKD